MYGKKPFFISPEYRFFELFAHERIVVPGMKHLHMTCANPARRGRSLHY